MYKITAKFPSGNDLILYDPAGTGALPILGPKQTEELNQPGSLTFSLLHPHEAYGLLEGMKTYISSEKEGTEIFYGRVLDVEPDELTGQETITCEGALSFLNDGFLSPDPKNSSGTTQSQTMTAEAFFRRCIDEFNADIGNDPRRVFTVGNVTVARKDETRLYQITQFTSAKEAIEQNLLNNYGGFLKVYRSPQGQLMIDWVEDYGVVDSGRVELGENVISQSNRLSGENLFTAIRPVGKDGLVHSTTPIIDVYPAEEMAEYGRIVKNIDFPGITSESDLLAAGQALVQRINKTIYRSSEISLLDLHFVDDEEPEVNLGNRYTNIAGLEGDEVTVSTRNRDYENPQNDSISLKNAKHLEGNGIDDFKNNDGGISKQSSRSSGGVGMALKYYHELQDEATLIADRVRINGQRIDIAAETLIETGNEMERLSTVTGDLGNRVTGIEGTGVIQNSDRITQVAGKFRVETLPGESTTRVILDEGAKLSVEDDGVYSDVIGADGVRSIVTQTATEIRSEISASNSTIYSSIEQTASAIRSEVGDSLSNVHSAITQTANSIRSEVNAADSDIYSAIEQSASQIRTEIVNTESGLYNYILQTASGTRQYIVSTTNRTWVQDTDPTTPEGGGYETKEGDIWIESTSQGTWEGAEGFNWEHDGQYDWTQIQGAKVWAWKNNKWELAADQQQLVTYSDVIDTAEHYSRMMFEEFVNDGIVDELGSRIDQTARAIRLEVFAADSRVYSAIEQTASYIRAEVANELEDVGSTIEQTATQIRAEVHAADSQLHSAIEQTASNIRAEVANELEDVGSTIEQTANSIRSEVHASDSQLYSAIEQTASGISLQVANKPSVARGKTAPTSIDDRGLKDNDIWIESENQDSWDAIYDANISWDDESQIEWNKLRSDSIWVYRNGQWVQALDGVNLVNDADIKLAENSIRMFARKLEQVNGEKEAYYAELKIDSDRIRSEVLEKYKGLSSSITQTATQIRSEVKDTKNDLNSSITQTAEQIRSEVNDNISGLRSSITQNADKISLVVEGTGANAHIKPASIVAAINAQSGQSIVKLSADVIELDGDAVASSLTGKNINADELGCDTLGIGGDLYFDPDVTLHGPYGDTHSADNMIVAASVDNNMLTLTPLTGSPITFSKATTLSPTWSGSVLTMSATQTNGGTTTTVARRTIGFGGSYGAHDVEFALTQNGYPTRNSATQISVPIKVVQQQGGGATTDRHTTNLNYSISSLLQTKSVSSNGDVTPDSSYIGLSKVTVSGVRSTKYTLKCTAATPVNPSSSIKNYTFTLQGVYSFSSGSSYDFYR